MKNVFINIFGKIVLTTLTYYYAFEHIKNAGNTINFLMVLSSVLIMFVIFSDEETIINTFKNNVENRPEWLSFFNTIYSISLSLFFAWYGWYWWAGIVFIEMSTILNITKTIKGEEDV